MLVPITCHSKSQAPPLCLTPLDVILTWTYSKGLSANSGLIRCNHISSQSRYIKHYSWWSGILFLSPSLPHSPLPPPPTPPSLYLNMRHSSSLIFSLSFPNKPPIQLHWNVQQEPQFHENFPLNRDFFGWTEDQLRHKKHIFSVI